MKWTKKGLIGTLKATSRKKERKSWDWNIIFYCDISCYQMCERNQEHFERHPFEGDRIRHRNKTVLNAKARNTWGKGISETEIRIKRVERGFYVKTFFIWKKKNVRI